ncbi:MAG: 2-oxoglutarate dehydrogenase complex dihydrolipoyllysine-residue succinyltransferase [Gammaproteobacteria bacterium]|jgi:2-oxoglutarate dehydrogenase E2 component (dihydrolipoamide succinyltransferase)
MSIDIRVPGLPESVADATVLSWHKQPGEAVTRDENLVDLETDKVVLEVPAPADGVLTDIQFNEGDTVEADQVLAILDENAEPTAAPAQAEKPEPAAAAKTAPREVEPKPAPPSAPAAEPKTDSEPVLTPSVRRLVKELNVDASKIRGTGKNGRILKSDVMKYLDTQDRHEHEEELEAVRSSARPVSELPQGARPEERVPMTRLRARIAERLLEAQSNAAILTTFNEVDLQAVMDLRSKYKDLFEKQHDTRLGFMSFFIKAAIEALKKFPEVNASVDGNDIIYHGYYDIGIAVGSPRGLVVPVLRDADRLSFSEIESSIKAFGKKAQDGTLSYDELTGGTFTISNGGVYGSMLSTPILNPPQSGILGMHNIQQRPVVVDGEIVIRPMMYLALSYDHRIIDGRGAVQFLVTIKQLLEDPARMLLNV